VKRVFISLADKSASNYIYEIFKEGFNNLEIYGLTDERLETIGIRRVARYSEISTVGLVEALNKIPKFLKIYRGILNKLRSIDTLILCDAPALNLRLLREARKIGVKKVIYFISPQVWAWKPKRAESIGNLVDHLIVILPFEKKIYERFPNLKVHYLGHPLVDLVKPVKTKKEFLRSFREKPLPILLGSRSGEIKRHVKLFRDLVHYFKKDFEPVAPTFIEFEKFIKESLNIKTLAYDKASYDCFFYSDVSIIASGTASLESALAGNPHLVYYNVNPLTYIVAKRLVKVPYISLVNILLKREVVPELIQKGSREILNKFYEVYENKEEIRKDLEPLRYLLGEKGVIIRLRELFMELI